MKTQKNARAASHLDNYCRLYGVTMPELDTNETHYFVAISDNGASVLYLHHPKDLLGRIVGGAMKRGTVLYVHNGWVRPLTWEKWKETWAKLFATKPRKKKNIPCAGTHRPYRSEIFNTMQTKRPRKKPSKRGCERTFIANISMNRLSHPYDGMSVQSL